MLKRFNFLLIALSFLLTPLTVSAAEQDVGFIVSNFYFSETPLIAGNSVRMYGSIKNFGNEDMTGFVTFSLSGELISDPIPFKSVSGSAIDNIFIDFVVPSDNFNILATLGGMEPTDLNSSNNTYLSPIYRPLKDSDRDGITNDDDNCPLSSNTSQRDSDNDGIGDECDDTPFPPEPEPEIVEEVAEVAPFGLDEEDVVEVQSEPGVVSASEPESENFAEPELVDVEVEVVEEGEVSNARPDGTFIAEENLIASFSVEGVHWNTYAFKALGDADANYTWEFSDGTVLDGREVDHVFPGYGEYEITLTVAESDGNFTSRTRILDISFFHFDNPLFILSFLLTLIILISGGVYALKNR